MAVKLRHDGSPVRPFSLPAAMRTTSQTMDELGCLDLPILHAQVRLKVISQLHSNRLPDGDNGDWVDRLCTELRPDDSCSLVGRLTRQPEGIDRRTCRTI